MRGAKMNPPWVTRLEQEIKSFDEIISRELQPQLLAVKKSSLKEILKRAISQKKYDIYHSTTIEGYNITPQEVEAALLGTELNDKKSFEKLKNKMAIVGHSHAFEYIIDRIKHDFGKTGVSKELISESYFRLFKPSVDVNIIDRYDLIGFRKVKVYIRNSRYVPPSYEKVQDLIKSFIVFIERIENSIIKAILTHYFFVTIHPYVDGNGRCGRLLMNYVLCTSGYHWITITKDKRDKYFQALQNGQLGSNIIPFSKFILSILTNTA